MFNDLLLKYQQPSMWSKCRTAYFTLIRPEYETGLVTQCAILATCLPPEWTSSDCSLYVAQCHTRDASVLACAVQTAITERQKKEHFFMQPHILTHWGRVTQICVFYITTVQDGWRKSAFLTRACFPCTVHLIMQYIEPVSEWSCWRMFVGTWPHSELTFRHRASCM